MLKIVKIKKNIYLILDLRNCENVKSYFSIDA